MFRSLLSRRQLTVTAIAATTGATAWMLTSNNMQKQETSSTVSKLIEESIASNKMFQPSLPSNKLAFCAEFKPGYKTTRKDLPTYRRNEVMLHNGMLPMDPSWENQKVVERGIWATLGNGVYRVDDFIPMHPGGNLIFMGAGRDLGVAFAIYPIHLEQFAQENLESFRIGNVHPDDVVPLDVERADKLLGSVEKYRLEIVKKDSSTPIEIGIADLKQKCKTTSLTASMHPGDPVGPVKEMLHTDPNKEIASPGPLEWFNDGKPATYKGVTLIEILDKVAKMKHLEEKYKNKENEPIVCICAFDGYCREFTWLEVKGNDRTPPVMLAFDKNNEPLERKTGGPIMALVPNPDYVKDSAGTVNNISWTTNIKILKE